MVCSLFISSLNHLPGKYLSLIEAKFTSRNTYYERGPRKNNSSLTLDELIELYQDPGLQILDVEKAESAQRVAYQLWRNTIFAEWMASVDHPNTRAYHVNLVCQGKDEASEPEFRELINPEHQERFQRLTWEQIYTTCTNTSKLGRLRRYLETKTAGLRRAFKL